MHAADNLERIYESPSNSGYTSHQPEADLTQK
jgi:hypothetical protein